MNAAPITRRQVLSGATVGLLTAGAGCISTVSSRANRQFENWTPEEGSWPLPWYDLQNTSCNPAASPPRRNIEIVRTVDVNVEIYDVLLAGDYLVAYGDGAQVFEGVGDDAIWGTDDQVSVAAFGPPNSGSEGDRTLYLTTETNDQRNTIVTGIGLRDSGTEALFSTEIERQNIASILPTETALFVGSMGVDLFVFDPKTGDQIGNIHGRHAAIQDDTLLTTTYGRVSAYEITTGWFSDQLMKAVWEIDKFEGRAYHPATANKRLLVGSFGTADGSSKGYLHCLDVETGDRLWDPKSFGWATWTPAIDGDVGYVAGNDPESGTGHVAALDLNDGSALWSHDLDWRAIEPITAGNGVVLVRHDGRPEDETPGYIEAYDSNTGETLWSFELDTEVRRIRAVEDIIYLCAGETLYVLGSA